MAKKVTNFNAMRPVLIKMHNEGNAKPINKDHVVFADVDVAFFTAWVSDVNALRETVVDYVTKKHNRYVPGSTLTDDDVWAARERIYPKWKEVLSCGENSKTERELHVSDADVEDLVGFAWNFMKSSHGTVIAPVNDVKFRQKVESLVGCAIAKNAVLTDGERDTLDAYYAAQKRKDNCLIKASELKTTKKNWELMNRPELSDDFKAYINEQIAIIDKQIEDNDKASNDADAKISELAGKARVIENKIKVIA